jgi:hypothetical protein
MQRNHMIYNEVTSQLRFTIKEDDADVVIRSQGIHFNQLLQRIAP